MFPGFVYMYKDTDDFIHLYFYAGFTEKGTKIYKDIDLANLPFQYEIVNSSEFVKDYKFLNKTIIKIKCQLVEQDTGKIITKILTL